MESQYIWSWWFSLTISLGRNDVKIWFYPLNHYLPQCLVNFSMERIVNVTVVIETVSSNAEQVARPSALLIFNTFQWFAPSFCFLVHLSLHTWRLVQPIIFLHYRYCDWCCLYIDDTQVYPSSANTVSCECLCWWQKRCCDWGMYQCSGNVQRAKFPLFVRSP